MFILTISLALFLCNKSNGLAHLNEPAHCSGNDMDLFYFPYGQAYCSIFLYSPGVIPSYFLNTRTRPWESQKPAFCAASFTE